MDDNERESYPDMEAAMNGIAEKLEEFSIRRAERLAEAVKELGPQNAWSLKEADEVFELDGLKCWIWHNQTLWDQLAWLEEDMQKRGKEPLTTMSGNNLFQTGYCGYACFPEKPVIEPGYDGILTYIPVHGGITYVVHDEIGSVYGFDTGHATSADYPIRDKDWIKKNILLMILGIKLAAHIEPEYLAADGDNQKRAELVQPLVDLGDELNFGTLMNLIGGEL